MIKLQPSLEDDYISKEDQIKRLELFSLHLSFYVTPRELEIFLAKERGKTVRNMAMTFHMSRYNIRKICSKCTKIQVHLRRMMDTLVAYSSII